MKMMKSCSFVVDCHFHILVQVKHMDYVLMGFGEDKLEEKVVSTLVVLNSNFQSALFRVCSILASQTPCGRKIDNLNQRGRAQTLLVYHSIIGWTCSAPIPRATLTVCIILRAICAYFTQRFILIDLALTLTVDEIMAAFAGEAGWAITSLAEWEGVRAELAVFGYYCWWRWRAFAQSTYKVEVVSTWKALNIRTRETTLAMNYFAKDALCAIKNVVLCALAASIFKGEVLLAIKANILR